jgi:hypothetical protein
MKPFGQKKMVRKMRFISDQEGIMNRYLREQEHWDAHLNNTKKFILGCFHDQEIKNLAVLGSGWLLDLPLKELSKKYKKIVLVDVFHPPQIVKKAGKYPNVTLHETDLSGGGIQFCWDLRKTKEEHLERYVLDEFSPTIPDLPFKPDAFISLNLLSQLDSLLVEFLARKKVRVTDTEVSRFRATIQQFHLDWITRKPGCLVTDAVELTSSPDNILEERSLIQVDFPESRRTEEWTWDFDLDGTYHQDRETRMKVRAMEW